MYRCNRCGAFNRIAADHVAGKPVCGRCKELLDVSGAPQDVSADRLAQALASSPVPVVVDFWAPWCGPCRTAGPILEELARRRAGKLVVLKVNSDSAPELMAKLQIRSIPTFVAFTGGEELARHSGALPASAFERWVDGVSFRPAA